MENLLVTGGAGFIGSHLVEALLKNDNANLVIVVDNLSMSDGIYINGIKNPKLLFKNGDATNYNFMSLLINRYNISTVFHLATSPLVFSLKEPEIVFDNITGMQKILLECQRQGFFKKLITYSTSEVYGSSDGLFLKETDRLAPRTPYAAAKAASDLLTQSYGESFDLDYAIIRPFNNYGPRKQVFLQGAGIIPTTVKLLSQRKKIPVYGDGSYCRDFVFVEDTVKATILAWESKKCSKRILNVTNGFPHTILEVIKDIAYLMQVEPEIEFLPNRNGDVTYLCGDGTATKNLIGFSPEVQWEDGLKRCIEFYSI